MRGKKILITGGASGIGRSLVKAFCYQHAKVTAIDIVKERLDSLKENLEKNGFHLNIKVLSVCEREDYLEFAQQLGEVDIWINNAGIAHFAPYSTFDIEAFRKLMDVNFWGVVNGTDAALTLMKKRGQGTIVNMASVAGLLPSPLIVTYGASKHAVVGYTRSLREEYRDKFRGIHFLLVLPGFVDTQIIDDSARSKLGERFVKNLESPDLIARNIIRAIKDQREEFVPTKKAKAFLAGGKIIPGFIRRTFSHVLRG